MAVFTSIAAYLGATLLGSFFGSPWFVVIILYAIVIGIGLMSKMSFDGMMLIVGIVTIISGTWIIQTNILTAMFMIGAGLLLTIAMMRFIRH